MKAKRIFIFSTIAIFASAVIWLYSMRPKEAYFILTSEGLTATTWLTEVLNTIPAINCTHYNNPSNKNLDTSIPNINQLSLDQYFSIIKKYSPKQSRIQGNINGYILSSLLAKNPSPNVRIANLIRHPVTHLDSMYRFWLHTPNQTKIVSDFIVKKQKRNYVFAKSQDHYTPTYNEALQYAKILHDKYGYTLNDDIPTWTFLILLGRYNRLHSDIVEADFRNIPQFRFEDFTKDTNTLSFLVTYISNNTITLSKRKLANLLNIPQTNVNHVQSQTAEQIYNAWEPWQQQAFKIHLQAIGSMDNAYSKHGYDLSFVAL